ncbi:MAG: FAD-binding oxidoreductase [Acidimicrobiia bacterium]|nr:FAD-binding oxidoreductase [Acidimicrobiia bacterium]RZV41439.1 MAG: FAD-binding oxidoreductase [Acidimicrobiia bacterium]
MLLSDIATVVGFDHCLTDPDLRAAYEVDWTGRYRGLSPAVIRPGSVDELSAVLALCHGAGQPVVVQGGNTGMVGGGVPLRGELVVSVGRLGNLQVVSERRVRAGAGATLGRLQQAADSVGAGFGVDTAARDSATIGGMIATNAGGINVVRFGPMGDQLLDAGVVLADGSYLPSLRQTGPDHPAHGLIDLLAGSEGILAVVAHADLTIAPDPAAVAVAMIEVPAARLQSLVAGVGGLPSIYAIELFGGPEVELAASGLGRSAPLSADWLALVECRSDDDPAGALAEVVGDLPAVVATNPSVGRELWLFREALTEGVSRLGIPHKFDVRVPHAGLNDVRASVTAAVPNGTVFVWGHAFSNRDGHPTANLHINIIGEVDDEAVFDVIENLGGSIAAEHGIGTAKRHRADRARDDLAALAEMKRRLDPKRILNPAVLLPDDF